MNPLRKHRLPGFFAALAIVALVVLTSCDREPPEPPEPPPVADLTISISDGLDGPVEPGQEILYRLTYANVGDTVATDVVITMAVPVGTSFDAAQSGPPWNCTGIEAGGTCTFTADNLPAGTDGTTTFAVRVDDPLEDIEAIASETRIAAASGATDPTPANNTATETTSVAPKPPPPTGPVISGVFCEACAIALERGWIDPALVDDYRQQCTVCSNQ